MPLTVVAVAACSPPRSTARSAGGRSCGWPTTSRTSPRASRWSRSGCSCSAAAGWSTSCSGRLAPDPSWLVNSGLAMPVIALFVTWKQLGFFILLYLAALQNVPKELYESAATDGAGRLKSLLARDRAGGAAGDHAGGHPGDHHRRQPVHRALPADQRRRPGRRLRVTGAPDVPEGHRAGQPRHRGGHRRAAGDRRAADLAGQQADRWRGTDMAHGHLAAGTWCGLCARRAACSCSPSTTWSSARCRRSPTHRSRAPSRPVG